MNDFDRSQLRKANKLIAKINKNFKRPKYRKVFSYKKWKEHNTKIAIGHLPYNPIFNNATSTDTNNANDINELEKLKRKRNRLSR